MAHEPLTLAGLTRFLEPKLARIDQRFDRLETESRGDTLQEQARTLEARLED